MRKKPRPRQSDQGETAEDPGLSKIAIAICAMILVAVFTMAGCSMTLGHFMEELKPNPDHTITHHQ